MQQLTRSNASLRAQQRSLSDPATILRDARALGMVRAGEHPYVVTGLPATDAGDREPRADGRGA